MPFSPIQPASMDLGTSPSGTYMALYIGNVYFVNSAAAGASTGTGSGTISQPFKTLNAALAQCSANNGDVIFVQPGHVETVAGAAGLNFGAGICDGVTVYFLGNAADRAQINLVTSTAAQVVIAANNVTLVNPKFVAGIDAIVSAILVTGSDCTMKDVEFFDGTTIFTTIQVQTTAAANRLTIDGYTYYEGTAGTAKTEAIRLVGGDHHRVYRLNISGNFSTANVNNVTTATTRFLGQSWFLTNTNTADTAAGAAAGLAAFVSTSTFLNPDSSQTTSGFDYCISKTLALPQTGTATIFTVAGGPIAIVHLSGYITVVIGSVANATKLHFAPSLGGTATDICATVDVNAAAAGDLFVLATSLATAAVLVSTGITTAAQATAEQLTQYIMAPGAIQVTTAGSDGGTGRIQWCLRYRPLSPNVLVF